MIWQYILDNICDNTLLFSLAWHMSVIAMMSQSFFFVLFKLNAPNKTATHTLVNARHNMKAIDNRIPRWRMLRDPRCSWAARILNTAFIKNSMQIYMLSIHAHFKSVIVVLSNILVFLCYFFKVLLSDILIQKLRALEDKRGEGLQNSIKTGLVSFHTETLMENTYVADNWAVQPFKHRLTC